MKAMQLFPNWGHLFSWLHLITMRFLCSGVVGSKLAQSLIQRKNGKRAHYNQTEEYVFKVHFVADHK